MVMKNENFGHVIKEARLNVKLTREELSEMTGISIRYIAAIENESKKPRFEIMRTLIRALGMDANTIYYPDKKIAHNEKKQIINMLSLCDEYEFSIVSAVVRAVLKK